MVFRDVAKDGTTRITGGPGGGTPGAPGQSAYEIALDHGFVGSEVDWLASLEGVDGTDGTDGYSVLSGAGAPSGGIGVNGDFYIDTTAHSIYGPKTAGSWGSPTPMVGATGPGASPIYLFNTFI